LDRNYKEKVSRSYGGSQADCQGPTIQQYKTVAMLGDQMSVVAASECELQAQSVISIWLFQGLETRVFMECSQYNIDIRRGKIICSKITLILGCRA